MKKFLKFLLIVLIWVVIGVAIFVVASLLGHPDPLVVAGVGVTALILLWLLFLGIRRLIVRYRARQRVEQLVNVEQPEGRRFRLGWPWSGAGELERRFKEVVKLLRRSRLRDKGDPVYVLPWYLLLGPDGAGKTSMLYRSRLPAPTIDHEALRADGAGVAWWLTNEAVLLDAPGACVAEGRHRDWGKLIGLLARYREREPLNGVVVAVPLETLGGDNDALFEQGRRIRKRVDELMRGLKLRLPIYLVVTKCDQLPGFRDWCAALPRELLDQPMGHAHDGEGSVEGFVRGALNGLSERIKALMLPVMNERPVGPDFLRLPMELERLRPGLVALSDGLFQGNAYEDSPLLRGLYFSGAYTPAEGQERQVFAQELFTRVLPADRAVRSTLNSAEKAEQVVRRVVLSGWGLALVVLGVLLTTTFMRHHAYFEQLAEDHGGEYVRGSSLTGNINQLYALRDMIRQVEDDTGKWWMPWFAFTNDGARPLYLEKLHNLYLNRFREEVQQPVLSYFDTQANRLFYAQVATRGGRKTATPAGTEEDVALYIGTITRRIALLRAYLDGADEATLSEMPGPFEVADLFFADDVEPVTAQRVNALYIQALLWNPDRAAVEAELDALVKQLAALIQMTGNKLSWLVPWANGVVGESVRLSDFWIGSGTVPDEEVRVPGAFTLAGRGAIEDFFTELSAAGLGDQGLEAMKAEFDRRYQADYLAAWERFALSFDQGRAALRGRSEWVTAIDNLASPRNPYFQALDVMSEQLAPFKDAELPDWAQLVFFYQDMRNFAPSDAVDNSGRNNVLTKLGLKLLGKTGAAGKALAKSAKSGLKTKSKLDKASAKSGKTPDERAAALEEAGKALGEYRQALTDIAFNSDTRSVSYAATAALFTSPDNPGKGDGPEARAHQTIKRLQTLIGKETRYNRAFWRLFGGPLTVVQGYGLQETACYLQEAWQNQFLTELEGVSPYKLAGLMFGEGGKLWGFMDADLKPFVERRLGAGYVPVKVEGSYIPFSQDFLAFASKGRDSVQGGRDKYPVLIESLPTSSNASARYHPNKTALLLQCQAGDQTVVNYNFPVTHTINYTPDCGRVTLAIDVGRYTLEKIYTGPLAFAEFLRDYRAGRKRLLPGEFPELEETLKEFDVQYIDVEFRFRGHGDVIALLEQVELDPPRQLAACWD